jgi:copper chaperone
MSEQIVKIKGMTCGHCEGRVTKELLSIPGVTSVVASAEKATAVITSDQQLTSAQIDSAVAAAGYSVIN